MSVENWILSFVGFGETWKGRGFMFMLFTDVVSIVQSMVSQGLPVRQNSKIANMWHGNNEYCFYLSSKNTIMLYLNKYQLAESRIIRWNAEFLSRKYWYTLFFYWVFVSFYSFFVSQIKVFVIIFSGQTSFFYKNHLVTTYFEKKWKKIHLFFHVKLLLENTYK